MSCACACGTPRRPNPCGCACQCGCGCDRDVNRPGLETVAFGDGWYDAAFRRMRERLSGADLPALAALTARSVDESIDPAIALLDAWACVSEILSFYNERSVNESYLPTCIERRSAIELARLVGYAPRPGVAADAWLAFTLDDLDKEAVLQVPAGTLAYSQPGPGETMQPFETEEALDGRPRWSAMRPRLTTPQWLVTQPAETPARGWPIPQNVKEGSAELWLKGIVTQLTPGAMLLFDFGASKVGRAIAAVEPLPRGAESTHGPILEDQTRIAMQSLDLPAQKQVQTVSLSGEVLKELVKPPSLRTAGRDTLELKPAQIFGGDAYAPLSLLGTAHPGLRGTLGDALLGTRPKEPTGKVTVYAMRLKAALHGHNAPLVPNLNADGVLDSYLEWNADGSHPILEIDDKTLPDPNRVGSTEIALDAVYDGILPGSYVAILIPEVPKIRRVDIRRLTEAELEELKREEEERLARFRPNTFDDSRVFRVLEATTVSLSGFNLPARVSWLRLDNPWLTDSDEWISDFSNLRGAVIYAQSEKLELVDRPITAHVCDGGPEAELVLDGYYEGLQPGRRLVVSGDRADLPGDAVAGITGVQGTELVMITSVAHRARTIDGLATTDTIHTWLTLDPPLRYCYTRSTVTIYGNVARATHGESRAEVLGGGDATRALQEFELRQAPLTYVPAPTATGIDSTLEVRVNDLRWHEAPNAAAISGDERHYITRTDDDANVTVVTGLGARLPSGRDNVRATYRTGIGAPGNVRAGQISVLGSQPIGVMGVTNPLPATGGADRDGLEHIRSRAPIGLASLDRLVSASDYEDFARAFAGIGKAKVIYTPPNDDTEGRLELVVAGEHDAPLSQDSALLQSFTGALVRFGDLTVVKVDEHEEIRTKNTPTVAVEVRIRTARLIAMRARVRLLSDYLWEAVLPQVRAALLARFGFDARELGERVDPGLAIAAMQGVRGVAYVDLQAFGVLDIGSVDAPKPPAEIAEAAGGLLGTDVDNIPVASEVDADTIAYLAPEAAGTLLLTHWNEGQP